MKKDILIKTIVLDLFYFLLWFGILGIIVYQFYLGRQPIHDVKIYRCQPQYVYGDIYGVGKLVDISGLIVIEVGWPDPLETLSPVPSGEARIISGLPEELRRTLRANRHISSGGFVAYIDNSTELHMIEDNDVENGSYTFYYRYTSHSQRERGSIENLQVDGTCYL